MASCVGYLLWLTRYMRGEFALGFLFSGIGTLLFLAGILNFLKEGAIAICLGGLILCVRERHRIGRKTLLTHGTVLFTVAAVFFLFLLKDARFTHYDNFSHWARAVAVLLNRNAFPSFLDEGIMFSAYPTGSASFIYYVVKILGARQEWPQMWAQAFLMAGLLAGLFAFGDSRGKRILILGGAIILLAGNTDFCDLLVDTLLPIAALSAMAFCVYYREEIREKFLFLLPWLVFLVSIKNSGALFAALILFYVYLLIRPVGRGPVFKHWLLACLVPLAVLFLWEKHVSQVFPGGGTWQARYDDFLLQKRPRKKILADSYNHLDCLCQEAFPGRERELALFPDSCAHVHRFCQTEAGGQTNPQRRHDQLLRVYARNAGDVSFLDAGL